MIFGVKRFGLERTVGVLLEVETRSDTLAE
jgi:hypothetical protein